MATDKKITDLPDASLPIASGVKFEAVQGGINVKVDADDMPGSGGGGVTSVSGTSNRITVDLTNPAVPVINIAAAYDAAIAALLALKGDALVTFRRLTASHTLDATDLASVNAGQLLIIEMNVATANTLTIPLNSAQAFPIGTIVYGVWYGAGQTTIAVTGGVTPRVTGGSLAIPTPYMMIPMIKVGTNEWYIQNGLSGFVTNWGGSLAATGFSATTTNASFYYDNGVTITLWTQIQGTSNATTFTFQLPFAMNGTVYAANFVEDFLVINSGTTQPGRVVGTSGSTTITVNSSAAGAAFTGSGAKGIFCTITYFK